MTSRRVDKKKNPSSNIKLIYFKTMFSKVCVYRLKPIRTKCGQLGGIITRRNARKNAGVFKRATLRD